jgi:pimeloyl-ACP methyl ester carboxylesterase
LPDPDTTQRDPSGTAYDLKGPEGAPVVVLVHGLGLTRATWRDHVPILAENFRVLTYDLCGHGQSALPPSRPSLTVLSEQLRALLDHLRIPKAAIVGFSLGGMINRRFAMDYPDRAWSLVIQNSPHERDPATQKKVEDQAASADAGGPAATIDAALRRWFTPEFVEDQADIVGWVRHTVLANDPGSYAAHRYVLAAGVTELIRPEPPIIHPTLVMTCENDSGSTPAMSRAIASQIAGSECIIIPRLQHLGLLEEPQVFALQTRDFLLRHAPEG